MNICSLSLQPELLIKKEVIMPRGDRTGPSGTGPMTGRRMGNCVEESGVGAGFFGRGFGFNQGRGMGNGRNAGWFSGFGNSGVSEKTTLENGIRVLKDQLSSLEKQLSSFKKES